MLGKLNGIALGLVAAAAVATTAAATDVPESKRTKAGLYVTAAEAADMLNDPSVVFIDVRSRAEVSFLGLPSRVNVHIPYMVMPMVASYDPDRKGYGLELNPEFPMVFREYAEERGLAADTPIVLICRSGSRSARAADLINDMGFGNVYSVIDGFEGDKAKDGPGKGKRVMNGWRNAGLDWSYAIAPEQSYPGDRW